MEATEDMANVEGILGLSKDSDIISDLYNQKKI